MIQTHSHNNLRIQELKENEQRFDVCLLLSWCVLRECLMVDFRNIERIFRSSLSFFNLVFCTLSVNFLLVAYAFVTGGLDFDFGLIDGLFMYLFTCFLIYFMFFGPLVLVAFFIRLSRASEPVSWWDLSRIPENSSLYDAIMLSTVQYGLIKVILPVIDE